MKIYTRTGDTGSTGLFGGPRVPKDDCRIEAYGTVDELNAAIGMVRTASIPESIGSELGQIQHELFSIGAELATPDPDEHGLRVIGQQQIERLEEWIDQHESTLEPLKQFILPGGTPASACLHLARSICRRAERRVVTLDGSLGGGSFTDGETEIRSKTSTSDEVVVDAVKDGVRISDSVIVYLNRLSDYLFVLSRAVNHCAGVADVQWQRP
ncbi:MAG: cob(I)yrinic acid a,c-diamide adenosyltransferase [Pirellulaceae bacterium]